MSSPPFPSEVFLFTIFIHFLDGRRRILHDERHQNGLVHVILVQALFQKRLDLNEEKRVTSILLLRTDFDEDLLGGAH